MNSRRADGVLMMMERVEEQGSERPYLLSVHPGNWLQRPLPNKGNNEKNLTFFAMGIEVKSSPTFVNPTDLVQTSTREDEKILKYFLVGETGVTPSR